MVVHMLPGHCFACIAGGTAASRTDSAPYVQDPVPVCSCRPAQRRPSPPAACTCPATASETRLPQKNKPICRLSGLHKVMQANGKRAMPPDSILRFSSGTKDHISLFAVAWQFMPAGAARAELQRACCLHNSGRDGALADRQLELLKIRRDLAARQVTCCQHVLCGPRRGRCEVHGAYVHWKKADWALAMESGSDVTVLLLRGLKLRLCHTW